MSTSDEPVDSVDRGAPQRPTRSTDADLIARAARPLNQQQLAGGFWVGDVGAPVEADDGQATRVSG